uniref:Proline-rich receptor-like protein kinase PERK10 n=1 Tax=Drosophila rhopaloa TaxID=1041015 RepID=A0A6P4E9N0_DRORH
DNNMQQMDPYRVEGAYRPVDHREGSTASNSADSVLSTRSPTPPPFSPWQGMRSPEGPADRTPPDNTDSVSTEVRSPDVSMVVSGDVPEPPVPEPLPGDYEEEEPTTPTVARLARLQVDDGDEPGHRPPTSWTPATMPLGGPPEFPSEPDVHRRLGRRSRRSDLEGPPASSAREESEPESGLCSSQGDSDDEGEDVLDIHAREVGPDLAAPEKHVPAIAENPQNQTPPGTPARSTPPSTPRRCQMESPRTPTNAVHPRLELSPPALSPGLGPSQREAPPTPGRSIPHAVMDLFLRPSAQAPSQSGDEELDLQLFLAGGEQHEVLQALQEDTAEDPVRGDAHWIEASADWR